MGKRRLRNVLSVERLEQLKREGKTNKEIGQLVGFSDKSISVMVRETLPEELWGRQQKKEQPVQAKSFRGALAEMAGACARCDGGDGAAVDPESQLCTSCQRELAHGESYEDGLGRGRSARRWVSVTDELRARQSGVQAVVSKPVIEDKGDTSEEVLPGHPFDWMATGPAERAAQADVAEVFVFERLEALATIRELEELVGRLTAALAAEQQDHQRDLERTAEWLEQVAMALGRAHFVGRSASFVFELEQLEVAVMAWTGERVVIARDVTW